MNKQRRTNSFADCAWMQLLKNKFQASQISLENHAAIVDGVEKQEFGRDYYFYRVFERACSGKGKKEIDDLHALMSNVSPVEIEKYRRKGQEYRDYINHTMPGRRK